jgi:prophage regulatory protein
MLDTILRLPDVLKARGRSRSAHYADISEGRFTRPIAIGPRSVGWPLREVQSLNAARIAGESETEIRRLVTQLEAARRLSK